MNIHSTCGMALTNAMRGAVAGHDFVIRRGTLESEVFQASSPPIGHDVLTETGLELSEHDRVLFWKTSDVVQAGTATAFGLPQRQDVLIDQSDNTEWKVRPQGDAQEAWRLHGQDKSAVMVVAKRDN